MNSGLPTELRDLHARALSNRCHDYDLILEAADEIERLERLVADAGEWLRDNMPELHGN